MMGNDFGKMHDFLMKELRLMHFPVGITFLFSEDALRDFRARYDFHAPARPVTFCQAELGARMQGLNILFGMEKLWCKSARIGFGLNHAEQADILSHCKFCESGEQAARVLDSKPRFPGKAPLAAALIPLGNCLDTPDVVHFCCDNMQAYHLLNDWMAVQDVHPLRPNMCVNSSLCGGTVFTMNEQQANLTLACAGSYNSGKMERGEINVMIPGGHLGAMFRRMERRIADRGGISLTREGHPFPGADICQNCPLILFKHI